MVRLLQEYMFGDLASQDEPEVKSLKDIREDLSSIRDDDPRLLKYLRTQKITYPDNSMERQIGEPEMGQVSSFMICLFLC